MNLLDNLLRENPTGPLYHYTNAKGLLGILDAKELWASSHLHQNDHSEFKIAARLFKQQIRSSPLSEAQKAKFLTALVEPTHQTRFVVSLSRKRDLLSQWRGYCPEGDGYCLGFYPGNPLFKSAEQNSFQLVRCQYEPEEQGAICDEMIANFPDVLNLSQAASQKSPAEVSDQLRAFFEDYRFRYGLMILTAACKHKGFHEENEWRLVSQYPKDLTLKHRAGRFGIVPYFPVPLAAKDAAPRIDSITLGPGGNPKVRKDALTRLLNSYHFNDTRVVASKTPLRE